MNQLVQALRNIMSQPVIKHIIIPKRDFEWIIAYTKFVSFVQDGSVSRDDTHKKGRVEGSLFEAVCSDGHACAKEGRPELYCQCLHTFIFD